MSFFKRLQKFFREFNKYDPRPYCYEHDFAIAHITDWFDGTMIVHLCCKKCGSRIETLHDLNETQDLTFRQPHIEKKLIKQKYLIKKNRGLYFEPLHGIPFLGKKRYRYLP